MQLSQVPNKTISDKSFSHLSRSDGPLPAAHHGEVCEDLSNYRVINLTRPLFLLPAKAHSFETICLLFRIEHNLDFVLYCTVITDYQNKYWGSGTRYVQFSTGGLAPDNQELLNSGPRKRPPPTSGLLFHIFFNSL
jgi:hypothetical protein